MNSDMPLLRNAEQTAARLGGDVKASWLKERARRRQIPFTLVGGTYHWSEDHITAIIRQFEQAPSRTAETGVAPSRARRPAAPEPMPSSVTPLRARRPARRTA